MLIRYFAWLKQRTGCSQEELELPASVLTVADLIAFLGERHPRFAEAAAKTGVIRCAIDHEHAADDASINGAKEIAFFPPITGG